MTRTILNLFEILLNYYGKQNWWPADTQFEVVIGAILTQNTAWKNVNKAINNLKEKRLLEPEILNLTDSETIENLIKPSGFYRQKTKKIKNFLDFFIKYDFNFDKLSKEERLREKLLKINGIGKETADSILLYALELPYFVIDSYTKRLSFRLNIIDNEIVKYEDLQSIYESELPKDIEIYKEYHALIVEHSKIHCKKKPYCFSCPVDFMCKYYKELK